MTNLLTVSECIGRLKNGDVIAYPTEAVFGLGCDPNNEIAVLNLLQLKQRSIDKGLILIASDYQQLLPYIDDSTLNKEQKRLAFTSWPGPVTWIFPKNKTTPYFLTGKFDSIAVRVTNHPLVCQLCDLFGKPLISSSANLSGHNPCRTIFDVKQQFGECFPVLRGETGHRLQPSEIRDIRTGNIIREG
ncbi:Sua5/YciO/YrdC/YwlC family protein [Gilliamella sp. B2776]|uniref:Sua5/YciO/YrdC/YwlC family protein n=1 Tax=unclassified Gilliamella TaxID=2685620 RepID=UPI0022699CFC|nr:MULTISPECIES: Sua5/YciO/YrdC/YwlC family protein [unclassified Gilliamella]MCX8650233.1 Sua5/YciO/YrdC/YwlC family protein [Gilliamella sp. B2779]MCX8653420.1 Sua5/YciO/YrdC/YwlC family protein [Gilliamella sp. B2737]MCX8656275.1 Sua5/YciO/YrdC/YwlC family protein [Gilliamella sp. B2894]MCX8665118.1 Sua5/YciO/YrdC/YwlC family protein [Gilliamella sp. B2887]MCX8691896.1 Sua5/YciO/YrdC/YwlC family protein [Gilliamella sp. B2776]